MKPLVVRVGAQFKALVWIEAGRGWILIEGIWQELTEAPGLGGWVLTDADVRRVVAEHGFPEQP